MLIFSSIRISAFAGRTIHRRLFLPGRFYLHPAHRDLFTLRLDSDAHAPLLSPTIVPHNTAGLKRKAKKTSAKEPSERARETSWYISQMVYICFWRPKNGEL
jgi:hypothetical protein